MCQIEWALEWFDENSVLDLYNVLRSRAADTSEMSLQDLLQKDVKQVVGSNIRLVISSLPADYSVEKFIGN